MKRIIFFVSLLFPFCAISQQKPQYTQYILNNYIINPALSGIENYTDVKLSVRDQWVGFNGAPRASYLTIHKPLGKQDYKTTPTSFNVPGENPRGQAYWENYTASEPHHGIGMSMVNFKTGGYNLFSANLSYAYHIGLSARTNLSAGFAGGITKLSYDPSKATPDDPSDPSLGAGSAAYNVRPDLSAGLWLYSADYFIGLSAQQIIPQKINFTPTGSGGKLVPHLFLTAGYRFLINEDINAIPSLMVRYVSPVDPLLDVNLKVQYRDLFWLGGNCRIKDGYSALIGFNVGNTFNVGYAYDFTKSALNTVSRGTHELMIGFLLGNRFDDSCPRNIW